MRAAAEGDTSSLLAFGREVLAAQPFSVLLGTELCVLEPGRVELRLRIDPRLTQQHGFAHGGVVSYLADNALTFAGGSALRVPVVTSELKINYLRPAVGAALVARAHAISVGRTQAVCRCDVFMIAAAHHEAGGEEKLCAAAQGTITLLAPASDAAAPSSARQHDDDDGNGDDRTAGVPGDAR